MSTSFEVHADVTPADQELDQLEKRSEITTEKVMQSARAVTMMMQNLLLLTGDSFNSIYLMMANATLTTIEQIRSTNALFAASNPVLGTIYAINTGVQVYNQIRMLQRIKNEKNQAQAVTRSETARWRAAGII